MRGSSLRSGRCHSGSDEAVNASDTAGTHATTQAATRQPRFDEAGASSPGSASVSAVARSGASHWSMTSSNEQAAMGTSTAL